MGDRKPILGKCIDSILGVREQVGAALHDIFIVTRTWSGKAPGDGQAEDEEVKVEPTPRIRDFSHSMRLTDGGAIKSGDIILEKITKTSYEEADINGISDSQNIEKFFRVGDSLYKVISHVEELLWWNVQLRRISAQEKFPPNDGVTQ